MVVSRPPHSHRQVLGNIAILTELIQIVSVRLSFPALSVVCDVSAHHQIFHVEDIDRCAILEHLHDVGEFIIFYA